MTCWDGIKLEVLGEISKHEGIGISMSPANLNTWIGNDGIKSIGIYQNNTYFEGSKIYNCKSKIEWRKGDIIELRTDLRGRYIDYLINDTLQFSGQIPDILTEYPLYFALSTSLKGSKF